MVEYQQVALFVFDDEGAFLQEMLQENAFGTQISAVEAHAFASQPGAYAAKASHVLFGAAMEWMEPVMRICAERGLSVGFLPLPDQKLMQRHFALSKRMEENLEVALRADAKPIDLVTCNEHLMFFKGVTGRVPLIETYDAPGVRGFYRRLRQSIKGLFTIRLRRMSVTTGNDSRIETAVSGVMLLPSARGSLVGRLQGVDYSIRDGQIGAVLVSPFSVMEYLRFVAALLSPSLNPRPLPSSVGLVRSASLTLEAPQPQVLMVDERYAMELPVTCSVMKASLSINAPEGFWENNPQMDNEKESVKVANLPDAKESQKYGGRHIPFFSYASEERFRDLFSALREDAKISSTYVVLMLLSTMLATIGLFADSSAVVIGAMLLAPLMAPIVSLSMGMLRGDLILFRRSFATIAFGVLLALGASALFAYLFPDVELTGQMKARINPTLLDLGVAVVSGIAAAYSKSFKEVIQSLAGVAIAVALVPPLATAGIGLGRGEWMVFAHAFLLFFTNLVGIALAATFTFQMLGYSSVLKSRKSIFALAVIMVAITYPLYLSFHDIIRRHAVAKAMTYERFLVGDKYVIVKDAGIRYTGDEDLLTVKLVVREQMSREELSELKRKIEGAFGRKMHIDATLEYIL